MSIVPTNYLHGLMQQEKLSFGTMIVEIHQSSIMQMLANAGFDFVIIDGEHGPFSVVHIGELSRAARAVGITPIVRVPAIEYAPITQALDAGAQGIMIPRVKETGQVKSALSMIKYPPKGIRGSVLARGHTEFKSGDVQEAMREFNESTMLIVQIETTEAVEQVDALASIPGVNALLIGPNDLSIALRVPGEYAHPTFRAAVEKTIAACKKHSVVPAMHANDLATCIQWREKGMRMLSFNSEAGLLMQAGSQAVKEFRLASKGKQE